MHQFLIAGQESSLEIRQGLTSLSYLLESLTGHQNNKTPQGQEYIIAANIGFYIRLQGSFSNRSRLAIVYSVFSYESRSFFFFECVQRYFASAAYLSTRLCQGILEVGKSSSSFSYLSVVSDCRSQFLLHTACNLFCNILSNALGSFDFPLGN